MPSRIDTSKADCASLNDQASEYLSDFPEVAKEFHPTKNQPKTAKDITVGSRTEVWWRCSKGHEWPATPNSRLGRRKSGKIQGCPYCSGRLPSAENNLLSRFPDIAKELDEEKTGKKASEITPSSGQVVWWKCENDHSYSSKVANRTQLGTGCKFCGSETGPRAASADYNLQIIHPKLAKQWHPTKNGKKTPTSVGPGHKSEVWWLCHEGHPFKAKVSSRSREPNGIGCPYCLNRKVGYGNDLATRYPKLVKEWDQEKNHPLLPSEVTYASNNKVWWRCEKGHSWDAVISSRSIGNRGCRYCTSQSSRGEIRLLAELDFFFDDVTSRQKIAGKEADIFIGELGLVIEYDGAYFHADKTLKDIEKNDTFQKNGFSIIRVREEPLKKTGSQDVIVNDRQYETKCDVSLLFMSLLKEHGKNIKASKRGQIEAYIRSADFINDDLYNLYISYFPSPFPENSLEVLHPDVAAEWHPKKNDPLTPRNFTAKSSTEVWWQCKLGHEWKRKISNRTPSKTGKKGSGCPYCSGRLATSKNSIATKFPAYIEEWHPNKNGENTPHNISYGNRSKSIWWLCENGHEWQMTPNKRFGNVKRRGVKSIKRCPECPK